MGVHFGRVVHSQPVVRVFGEWGSGPVQRLNMAMAHEGSGATFNWQLKECRYGERFEEFAGTGAKSSIGAGGLVEPRSRFHGSAREQADRSIGCRTRLDTKPSRGAAVV